MSKKKEKIENRETCHALRGWFKYTMAHKMIDLALDFVLS